MTNALKNLSKFTPLLFICISFILLLLVSVSVPLAKTIYLFNLTSTLSEVTGSAKFGVWGYCVTSINVSTGTILGHSIGADATDAFCSAPKLGYTIDETLAKALHVDELSNLITGAATAALVLHPIVCALTFMTALVSLFVALRSDDTKLSRVPTFLPASLAWFTAILTTIVFIIDAAVVGSVRSKVHKDFDGDFAMNWGNAVWMVLVAAILLLVAVGIQFRTCCCALGTRFRTPRNGGKY